MPPLKHSLLSNTNNNRRMGHSILERRRKISIAPLQISSPMAEAMDATKKPINVNQKGKKQILIPKEEKKPPMAMGGFRWFFSCKYHQTAVECEKKKKMKKMKMMKKPTTTKKKINVTTSSSFSFTSSLSNLSASMTPSLSSSSSSSSSSSCSVGGSFTAMHMKKLSGCYECNTMADSVTAVSKVPSIRRNNFFTCSQCGKIFSKSENLKLHQAVKHGVTELGPEDNSRNIVEIIFKSSWLKKQPPMCKILRVLKINHTAETITRFENYRDTIKSKANKVVPKKHPRCIADGNELLRFYSTSFYCPLGLGGCTSLCLSTPHCNVCSIIKDGFELDESGRVKTMETSGRAHDANHMSTEGQEQERAMLVCRVIAGRVSRNQEGGGWEGCDSVGGSGTTAGLDQLFVSDPDAILPCFVVIYSIL